MTRRALHYVWTWVALGLTGCGAHQAPPASLQEGRAASTQALMDVIDEPGPLTVDTVTSTLWVSSVAGVINLDDPAAQAAGLEDGPEPVEIDFHVIRHPEAGTFLIDTGVERALRDDPEHAVTRGEAATMLHTDAFTIREPLGDYLAHRPPVTAVLLTHMHIDHVLGLPDLPEGTPVYAGPDEPIGPFLPDLVRTLVEPHDLRELPFAPDPTGRFAGVRDLLGDGSLWALHVPGHTPGSLAFLARTLEGPVLLTGDTCITRWGWQHGVEPGTFTADHEGNRKYLSELVQLAEEHPDVDVRLGHQRW